MVSISLLACLPGSILVPHELREDLAFRGGGNEGVRLALDEDLVDGDATGIFESLGCNS
jgi:hypothetical protein